MDPHPHTNTQIYITYSCNYHANRTQIFTLMCEQHSILSTLHDFIPMEFVS